MKTKLISLAIFIIVGQLVAFGFYKLNISYSLFIPMLISSTVAFFIGYKEKKTKSSQQKSKKA